MVSVVNVVVILDLVPIEVLLAVLIIVLELVVIVVRIIVVGLVFFVIVKVVGLVKTATSWFANEEAKLYSFDFECN